MPVCSIEVVAGMRVGSISRGRLIAKCEEERELAIEVTVKDLRLVVHQNYTRFLITLHI